MCILFNFTSVPIHTTILETNNLEDLNHILAQSSLPLVFCDSSYDNKFEDSLKRVSSLKKIVSFGDTVTLVSNLVGENHKKLNLEEEVERINKSQKIDFLDLILVGKEMTRQGKNIEEQKIPKRKPEDIVSVIYTSG